MGTEYQSIRLNIVSSDYSHFFNHYQELFRCLWRIKISSVGVDSIFMTSISGTKCTPTYRYIAEIQNAPIPRRAGVHTWETQNAS